MHSPCQTARDLPPRSPRDALLPPHCNRSSLGSNPFLPPRIHSSWSTVPPPRPPVAVSNSTRGRINRRKKNNYHVIEKKSTPQSHTNNRKIATELTCRLDIGLAPTIFKIRSEDRQRSEMFAIMVMLVAMVSCAIRRLMCFAKTSSPGALFYMPGFRHRGSRKWLTPWLRRGESKSETLSLVWPGSPPQLTRY